MDEAEQDRLIIERMRRRLGVLREQAALTGINTPPEVRLEIEDLEQQLGAAASRPGARLRPPRHNLDHEPVYFFGRDELMQTVMRGFEASHQTLILKGFGGVGKSTLARKIAYRYLKDGTFDLVVWIDIRKYRQSQVIDLSAVLDIIIRTFEPESGLTKEIDPRKKVEMIRQTILNRYSTLIVFDNFESILQTEAERPICDFIDQLPISALDERQALAQRTRVLITTRELSRSLMDLQPKICEVDKLDYDGARQFMDQKIHDMSVHVDMRSKHEIVYQICYGIPKLIESVIGQIPYISLADIQRIIVTPSVPLDQSDEIYGYLFEESWNRVLDEARKRLLMSMTFFVEHASPAGLCAVAELRPHELGGLVKKLHEMSLIEIIRAEDETVSYRLHPLTHKMSEAQIDKQPAFELPAARRFVEHYLALVAGWQAEQHAAVEREVKNIIAATQIAEEHGEWELLRRFHDPINQFMWLAGYWRERADANERLLRACEQLGDEALAAKILVEDLGFTFLRFEMLAEAEGYVRKGLQIYQRLEDQKGIALAIRHLGKSALLKGEYEQLEPGHGWEHYFEVSERLYSQSLEIRRALDRGGDQQTEVAIADLLLDFGRMYWLWGRKCERDGRASQSAGMRERALGLLDRSIEVSQEAEELFQRHGVQRGVAKALGNLGNSRKQLGMFALHDGEPERARQHLDRALENYDESLVLAASINKVDEIAHAKWGMAEIHELHAEDPASDRAAELRRAIALAADSNTLYRRIATPGDIETTQALLDRLEAKLGAAAPPEA